MGADRQRSAPIVLIADRINEALAKKTRRALPSWATSRSRTASAEGLHLAKELLPESCC